MKTIKTRDAERAQLAPGGTTGKTDTAGDADSAGNAAPQGDDKAKLTANAQQTEQAVVDALRKAAEPKPIGSNIQPATFKEMGTGNFVKLSIVIDKALADSHLTVEDWNAQGNDVREAKIATAVQALGLNPVTVQMPASRPVVKTPTLDKRPDLISVYQEAIDGIKARLITFDAAVANIAKVYKVDQIVVAKEMTDILNRPDNAKQPVDAPAVTVPLAHGLDSYIAGMVAKDKAFEDKLEKIIVQVPKDFHIMLDNGTRVTVKGGTSRIPRFLAEHWYAKANGLTIFDPKG